MSDFNPSSPFASGLTPNLVPNPPSDIPEAPGAGDAIAGLSPFKEALDVETIMKNLVLDRPLKLYIPNRGDYPQWEFRIINSIPQEKADAQNKGWKEVTDEKLTGLFDSLVAGTDKTGAAFRPLLMARPKAVGEHIRKEQRKQLRSLYAGMDPSNKDMSGKYTINVDKKDGTFGQFEGPSWRIKV